MLWQIYKKFSEFTEAVKAGDYGHAVRAALELIQILVPDDPANPPTFAAEPGDEEKFTEDQFKEDCKTAKAAVKSPPKGAKAVGAGGTIAVILIQTLLPVLIEAIRKWRKEHGG